MTPHERYRQLLLEQIDELKARTRARAREVKQEMTTILRRLEENKTSCTLVAELQEKIHDDQLKLIELKADLREVGISAILTTVKNLEEE